MGLCRGCRERASVGASVVRCLEGVLELLVGCEELLVLAVAEHVVLLLLLQYRRELEVLPPLLFEGTEELVGVAARAVVS